VENIQNANHTGASYNTTLNFSCQVFSNSSSLGTISSGSNISRSWTETIESSGTYACTFNVSDRTKNYGKQLKKTIIVKDIEPPTFLGRSWTQSEFISDTNISINKSFNQNETIEYFVKAKDNAGINNIIIEIYNGSYANKSLNLYLSYSEYEIWKFTEKSDILGYCNITKIYINDTSGNIAKINLTDYYEIIELKLNSSLANETLLINTTQTFLASILGNASPVSEVIANITLPSGAIETITFSKENSSYMATYIPKKSGSYLVNITAILSSGISKTTHLNFSVPYGNISVNSDEKIFLVENATYNLPIFIVPEKGDLINVTVNISIENESIVNTTNKSAALEKIFWEDYYQGKAIYFSLYSAQIGNTTINITAFSPALNKSASKSINITVIQNDTSPPIINNFTNYEIVNLNEINKFVVNTSENETEIKSVLLEITWPSNCTKNITATLKPNKLYELNFNGTNETGSYKFKIYSCNIAGICESTAIKEFNVTNIYNVFAFISGSNKGSLVEFNVSVKNVRGEEVKDFNLTLVIYNTEENITVVNNTRTNYASYRIRYDDPPTAKYFESLSENYIAYVHVEKNGNSGTTSKNFTVSEDLETTILYPDTKYYPPNMPVNLSVEVRDFDNEIVETASVTAYCPDCSKKYARLEYNSSTKKYTGYGVFISPNKDFSILIFSSSYFGGNKGGTATTLLTSQPQESGAGGGGGGGAPTGAGLTIPNCTCTEWEDKGCGMGTCKPEEIYQTRICSPAGCANETRCIFSPRCIPKKNFDISLSEQELRIKQGETARIFLNLINTGEKNLSISISVDKECCEINFTREIKLKKNERISLPLSIHSKLSQSPGSYEIIFIAESGEIKKKIGLRLIIESNELISLLSNIKDELPIIEKQIAKLEKLGIEVADLKSKIEEIKYLLKEANKSIWCDNLTALKMQAEKIKTNFEYVKLRIITLKLKEFLLENLGYLVASLILFLMFLYYITQVVLPYIKLKREIKELEKKGEDLVETRRATEKQFFMRKIDEPTFRAILSKTQQQILKNRSEIKNKIAEISLLKKKLNPLLMAKWILLLPISIAKKIASWLRNIKKRIRLYFKEREIQKKFVDI